MNEWASEWLNEWINPTASRTLRDMCHTLPFCTIVRKISLVEDCIQNKKIISFSSVLAEKLVETCGSW